MRIDRIALLAAGLSCGGVAAQAADWTGPYLGLNLGAGFGTGRASESGTVGSFGTTSAFLPRDISTSGILGGVQGGYLWRSGPFVFGVEADADAASITGEATGTQTQTSQSGGGFGVAPEIQVSTFPAQVRTTTDWLATLRARAGWARDNWLFSGTFGLAGAQLSYRSAQGGSGFPTTTTQAVIGFAAGAGIEYALTQSLSLRLDYLYVRLDDLSAQTNLVESSIVTTTSGSILNNNTTVFSNSVRLQNPDLHVLRVGADWHF